VYVTAYDIEKSFSYNKTVEITGHVRSLIHVQTHRGEYMLYFPRYGS